MKLISLVIPVFNEEETIPIFINEVKLFKENFLFNYELELVFINDGSVDNSLSILSSYDDLRIHIIDFSRNFGKENALFAGLEFSKGDVVIPIDVDLQDPLEVIILMLEEYEKGYNSVLAKRNDRLSDSLYKRKSAEIFYNVYNQIADIKIEPNVGDFRLMDRKVVDAVLKFSENQLFMKGLFNWVGFKTVVIEYKRDIRSGGKTKFNFSKLLKLAIDGFTSFSVIPLKVWLVTGFIIAFFSIVFGLKIIIEKIFFGISEHGYASLICAITFLGAIQLIGIGVLGEYISRIYLETKRRPKYIINKIISNEK